MKKFSMAIEVIVDEKIGDLDEWSIDDFVKDLLEAGGIIAEVSNVREIDDE